MSQFREAMLLHLRCELEAMVCTRVGMELANRVRRDSGLTEAYGEEQFDELAINMRGLVPDPREFA